MIIARTEGSGLVEQNPGRVNADRLTSLGTKVCSGDLLGEVERLVREGLDQNHQFQRQQAEVHQERIKDVHKWIARLKAEEKAARERSGFWGRVAGLFGAISGGLLALSGFLSIPGLAIAATGVVASGSGLFSSATDRQAVHARTAGMRAENHQQELGELRQENLEELKVMVATEKRFQQRLQRLIESDHQTGAMAANV